MTILLSPQGLSLETLDPTTELSSRPERTRISYFALLATTACAALLRESRMQIIKATGLDRESGERSGGICSLRKLAVRNFVHPSR